MKASVDILDQEFEVEYDIKITASGSPATGPSYASGGEPATATEFEVEVTEIRTPRQHADVTLELPAWLKQMLETHLSERDDIYQVAQDLDDEGMDPDYERDLRAEDRE